MSYPVEAMDEHQARKRILQILLETGHTVKYSRHGRRRAKDRGIPFPDLMRLLKRSFVTEPPFQDLGREEWTCVLEGYDADVQAMKVVVGVHPEKPIIVIVSAMYVR
jgi:hypothetical protein